MKSFKLINLLVVDDSILIVDALKQLFDESSSVNIIGICSDGRGVLSFIKKNRTDVIFIDLLMKNVDGLKVSKLVKNYNPDIKIIGFSLINTLGSIDKLAKSGVDGFISKYDAEKELMLKEIYRVMSL